MVQRRRRQHSISTGTNVILLDTNYPGGKAFYRVQATRP